MRTTIKNHLLFICLLAGATASAQDAAVSAKMDANRIMVGDQARMFIEVQQNSKAGVLQWANIPDTFNSLEVVEKGKIDTSKQGDITIYRQRLLVTGFDSGVFVIPRFEFSVIPEGSAPYLIQTDSFALTVQTVAVDTTKAFKGIKGIIAVKSSWMDYIWLIIAGIVLIAITAFVVYYFKKNKTTPAPVMEPVVKETLQQKYLRLLNELEERKLWQKDTVETVKEYYTQLTDIVRVYIEERFRTPVMELTTDEILYKVRTHKEMNREYDILSTILYTADLAKFARAQPMPAEHMQAMENAKQFVMNTKQVITNNTEQAS
jgi:HD superfamily phosphohydrolase YqeK